MYQLLLDIGILSCGFIIGWCLKSFQVHKFLKHIEDSIDEMLTIINKKEGHNNKIKNSELKQ